MIKLTIEIDNYGDYCGKCKQKWCLNPTYKGESEYLCSVFHKRLMRTVGGRRLCRLDQCIALDLPEEVSNDQS